jgi:hypothetical protein
MGNWKTERDAFVNETMAFVEAVRSHRPISTEAIVTPKQLPVGVSEHFQQPAPSMSEASQVVPETIEQPRLAEREEIRQRVANFKAHQQLFIREREDYALSTLMRLQGGVTAPKRKA